MITKFFTSVNVVFNPLKRAKTARFFLAAIPSKARQTTKVSCRVLDSTSNDPAAITVVFKDGKKTTFDPTSISFKDLVADVDRHSRQLQLQEDISS